MSAMDTTGASLPEEAIQYLQQKNIPDLMERLLHELIVKQPDEPLRFLAEVLAAPVVPKLIISGPPAAGKGTQCQLIAKHFGVVHISTGDLLRQLKEEGGKEGKEAAVYMEKGELVPDEIIVEIVRQRLCKEDVRNKGWLLDGFPRTRNQALAMQAAGLIPQLFVLLAVPDEVVIERIEGRRVDPVTRKVYHLTHNPPPQHDAEVLERLQQRADDTRDAVRRRLATYHRNCAEIVECYQCVSLELDGDRSPQEIFEDVSVSIKAKANLGPHAQ